MTKQNPQNRKNRVFIVDDHPVVREGLSLRINRQADMEVCGEAERRAGALDLIACAKPNLVIVDLALKDSSGLELIKDVNRSRPELPVLVLSMLDEAVYAERALRAGARGYVMKDEATDKVIVAARHVLAGNVYVGENLCSGFLNVLFGRKDEQRSSPADLLTDRELEVFELLGGGLSSREISRRLSLSMKTIEAYREDIKRKLGVSGASELLHRAFHWVQSQTGLPKP